MPRENRGKHRSGKISAERHFSTPDIEAALHRERTKDFPPVSSDALAAERYLREALDIVEAIYRANGLPPFPGHTDQLFAQYDGSQGWVAYEPPRTRAALGDRLENRPNFELQPWWALGYAAFGRDSEPAFASDIAAAIPNADRGPAVDWMRPFQVGYRLATSVGRWRVEFEMRLIVNAKQLEDSARGGIEGSKSKRRRHRIWQRLADEIWLKNPKLSKSEAARRVAERTKGKNKAPRNTIRQVIQKSS